MTSHDNLETREEIVALLVRASQASDEDEVYRLLTPLEDLLSKASSEEIVVVLQGSFHAMSDSVLFNVMLFCINEFVSLSQVLLVIDAYSELVGRMTRCSNNSDFKKYFVKAMTDVRVIWSSEHVEHTAEQLANPHRTIASLYLIGAWQGQWGKLPPSVRDAVSRHASACGEEGEISRKILNFKRWNATAD